MVPLGKACKKYAVGQKQRSVEKVPEGPEWPAIVGNNQSGEILPVIIRMVPQCHLARHARNMRLVRSRGASKRYLRGQSGQPLSIIIRVARYCKRSHRRKNDENSPVVPTIIRDGSVGRGSNHCQKYTLYTSYQLLKV
jgi:hypothetical protein